jgi:hypothetical protein
VRRGREWVVGGELRDVVDSDGEFEGRRGASDPSSFSASFMSVLLDTRWINDFAICVLDRLWPSMASVYAKPCKGLTEGRLA